MACEHHAYIGDVSPRPISATKPREVLKRELPWLENVTRAKRSPRLPVVLTPAEAQRVLQALRGQWWLMASLCYGAGLRLMECVRLRVKDIEFSRRELIVREGKGDKDRVTLLPASLIEALQLQLRTVKAQHEQDLAHGSGEVYLPYALARKYPNAGNE